MTQSNARTDGLRGSLEIAVAGITAVAIHHLQSETGLQPAQGAEASHTTRNQVEQEELSVLRISLLTRSAPPAVRAR